MLNNMKCLRMIYYVSQKQHIIIYIILLFSISYILFRFRFSSLIFEPIISRTQTNSISNDVRKRYDLPLTNIVNTNEIFLFYRHATSARNSSYPFISGDTFRAFSDYVFDETRQDLLTSVNYGQIVFVKADKLSEFFGSPFKSITKPFVLVTHNSDASAPGQYTSNLLNSNILKWYASNPSLKNHSKLSPIPIGLGNAYWPHGNLKKLTYALKNFRKPWLHRTIFLYVNFHVKNNQLEREKALSRAKQINNVKIIEQAIPFEKYLEQIGDAKFVLSPPGGGLDCHRTWEALYMGAAPIVLSSELDSLFSKTKSVIINDWSQLTNEFLLSFNFSSEDHVLSDVLQAKYWYKTFLQHRHDHQKSSA